MARLWQCGFENQTTDTDDEFTIYTGAVALSTTVLRTGTRSLRIASKTSATKMGGIYGFAAGAVDGPLFFRIGFRVDTLPSAENRIIVLSADDNFAAAHVVYITLSATGTLTLYDEDGAIGSASSALSTGDFTYYIEIQFDRTPAAGSEVVRARLNGVEFAGSATRSLSAGVRGLQVGGNLNAEAQTAGDWYFDDVAINDNGGSVQNSYPGNGKIIHLHPSAAGDNTAWARGGVDSGANWSQVSEINPTGATSYNESTTLNQTDDYNLDDSSSDIGSGDTVNVVAVGGQYAGSLTVSVATFVFRLKSVSAGTIAESTGLVPNFTGYVTNNTGSPRNYMLVSYTDPSGGNWTKAKLDTAQAGMRISVGGTNTVRMGDVWVSVDFTTATTVLKDPILSGGIIPFAR